MVYLPHELKHLVHIQPSGKGSRKHKYNACKTVVDGIKFDSKDEARRYTELKMSLNAGIIKNLELQPEFILQEAFRFKGNNIKAIKYKADFKYIDSGGDEMVEDVKGHPTPVYKLKKKLLLFRYPDINFREIKY